MHDVPENTGGGYPYKWNYNLYNDGYLGSCFQLNDMRA